MTAQLQLVPRFINSHSTVMLSKVRLDSASLDITGHRIKRHDPILKFDCALDR